MSDDWAGDVKLTQADAERWLQRGKQPYDVIVEDISMSSPIGVIKPYVSFDALPELIRGRLRGGGVAITNLLPLEGTPMASLEARVAHPHHRAVSITLDEYDNRIVVAGDALAERPLPLERGAHRPEAHRVQPGPKALGPHARTRMTEPD